MGASLDSREVFVPGTGIDSSGVRLTAPVPLALAWPALLLVLFALLTWRGGEAAGGVLTGGLVPLALWSAVAVPVLLRARRRPVGLAPVRLVARLSLAGAVGLPLLAVVAIVAVARSRPVWPGDLITALQWTAVADAVLFAWCAGWLRRVVRVVDPATPPGAVPPLQGMPWLPKSVDFGEDGLRFPKALPWIVGTLSVAVTFTASWAVSRGTGADVTFGQRELAWGVALYVAGGAWLPFLGRALGRGMRAGQIQAIGWAYLVGAVATVVLFTIASWNTALGPMIGFVSGLFAIVPGLRLISFARAYGTGLAGGGADAPTVPARWQDGADSSGS